MCHKGKHNCRTKITQDKGGKRVHDLKVNFKQIWKEIFIIKHVHVQKNQKSPFFIYTLFFVHITWKFQNYLKSMWKRNHQKILKFNLEFFHT